VIAEQPTMATSLPNIAAYSVVAAVHTRRGDLDAAARAVARAEALLPRLIDAFWWHSVPHPHPARPGARRTPAKR
jgi:hypothetical protein